MTDKSNDPREFTVRAIGYVRSSRTEVRDDFWGKAEAVIELMDDMPADSLDGLTEFSHVEVLFVFHRTDPNAAVPWARHPGTIRPGHGWASSPNAPRADRIDLVLPLSACSAWRDGECAWLDWTRWTGLLCWI